LKQRIDVLDSLRGFAASVVVFHHVHAQYYHLFPHPSSFIGHLLVLVSELNVPAVIFFFLLSGFSIALSLSNSWGWTKADINHYLYRRFRRIIPLYFMALGLTALCGIPDGYLLTQSDYGLPALAGNLLFLQCSKSYAGYWFPPYGGNGPLWTLSFEMAYYLFLPAMMLIMRRRYPGKQQELKLLHAGFVVAWCCSMACTWLNKQLFLPWVAFGTLFVIWYAGFWLGTMFNRNKLSVKHFILLLAVTAFHLLLSDRVPSSTLHHLSAAGLMVCCFLIVLLLPEGFQPLLKAVEKYFNLLFRRIGQSSYALYLFHFPLLELCRRTFPSSIIALIMTILLTLAFAVWTESWLRYKKLLFFKRNYMPSLQA
jgi:peptidoglycan/LPS O-acetylase OafA/YrhL